MENFNGDNLDSHKILDEFWQLVLDIYGTYCDSFTAFHKFHKELENIEQEILENTREAAPNDPEIKDIPIILESFSYGRFVPAIRKEEQKEMDYHSSRMRL